MTLDDLKKHNIVEIRDFVANTDQLISLYEKGELTLEQCKSLVEDEKRLVLISEAMQDLNNKAVFQHVLTVLSAIYSNIPLV